MSIAVSKPLLVKCGAVGTPAPTVQWYHQVRHGKNLEIILKKLYVDHLPGGGL